jgi:hypothetical protein
MGAHVIHGCQRGSKNSHMWEDFPHIYIYIYIYIYIHTYIYIYICVCVCVYIYIYIHLKLLNVETCVFECVEVLLFGND